MTNSAPLTNNSDSSQQSESKSITIVERWQKGGPTAYSIDEGETFHPTVQAAFEHREQVTTATTSDLNQVKPVKNAHEGTQERGEHHEL